MGTFVTLQVCKTPVAQSYARWKLGKNHVDNYPKHVMHPPETLTALLDISLPDAGHGKDGLLQAVRKVLQYSVNTWDQTQCCHHTRRPGRRLAPLGAELQRPCLPSVSSPDSNREANNTQNGRVIWL